MALRLFIRNSCTMMFACLLMVVSLVIGLQFPPRNVPGAVCGAEGFQCTKLRECIPKEFHCDGFADCSDSTDEMSCGESKCSASEWKCLGSQDCIPNSWRCDGDRDCDDKSDEVGCPPSPLVCTDPSHFCDNNTLCIEVSHLCDGITDCKDNSDEGGHCGAVDCELRNCEHHCTQGPIGPLCTCPEGQHLLPDGDMCSPPHPCHTWGTCSQVCIPFKHKHKCSCVSGYELQADGYNCKSNSSGAPYIIFSNRHELRSISLKSGGNMNFKTLISSLNKTIALDFYHHPDGDIIFWTDVVDDKIYRGTILDGALSNIEPVVQTGLTSAEGLAVDWVGENLYWVESNLNQIEVSKLNGSFRRTLIAAHMASPRAISLDPRVGMLFWTDWEEGTSRIESASMSGEGRRMVILGSGWPNGLTLDYALKRIYWIDAKSDSMHTVLYDGRDHREILRAQQLLNHPFGISLFGNDVYWTDWRTNAVIRANKFNGSKVQELGLTVTQPFDIKVLHPSRQPRDMNNPCAVNNGGCSHLCLLSFNETRQCNCPQIMTLGPDEKTCKPSMNHDSFSNTGDLSSTSSSPSPTEGEDGPWSSSPIPSSRPNKSHDSSSNSGDLSSASSSLPHTEGEDEPGSSPGNSIGSNVDDQVTIENLDVQDNKTHLAVLTNMVPHIDSHEDLTTYPTEDLPDLSYVIDHSEDLAVVADTSSGQREFKPPNFAARRKMATILGLGPLQPRKYRYGSRSKGNKKVLLQVPSRKEGIAIDGNCFFRSINYILTGDQEEHMKVRNMVVDHMSTIKEQLERYEGKLFTEQYLSNMRSGGKWATDVEIISAANLLGHDIVSYTKRGNSKKWLTYPASFTIRELSESALYIDHVDESHYEVVVSI